MGENSVTFQWTGIGCDVCGFGSVEDVDDFDPKKPCPDCGEVMLPTDVQGEGADK